jgi:hypothetical protein
MFVFHALVLVRVWNQLGAGYPDFTSFYSAGKIIRAGHGSRLYDEAEQRRAQQEFASRVQIRPGPLPYNHPPFEALVFLPLAHFPYFTAYLLWNLINLMLLIALVFLLRPHLSLLQQWPVGSWMLVLLSFFPIFIALLQGQDIILLLFVLGLVLVALEKKADLVAGCCLGLGLFRFHLVLPLALVLLWQRRSKALFGFLLVSCSLIVISIAVVGEATALSYPWYLWHLAQIAGRGAMLPSDMPNLRGLLEAFPSERIPRALTHALVGLTSVSLLLLAAARGKTRAGGSSLHLGFSLVLVLTVLVSYHAMPHDLSLLILPVLLLANYLQNNPALQKGTRLALLGPVVVLFLSPLLLTLMLYHRVNLLAVVLLLWMWGIMREIESQPISPLSQTTPILPDAG